MKRTISFLLALIFVLGASSCASQTQTETTPARTSAAQTASQASERTENQTQTAASSEKSTLPASTQTEAQTTAETPTPTPTPTPTATPTTTQTATEEQLTKLTEADMDLFKNSYDILYDRITDRGYAITSLTGTYVGMFTRDSSIQAMAHVAYGDSAAARSILRYLLSYHAALGLKYGIHIIDDLKEEDCGDDYLGAAEYAENPGAFYICQRDPETPIYSISAPDHGAAQAFVPFCDHIYGVEAHLTKTANTDTVHVSVRTDYKDPATSIVEKDYTFGKRESGWQSIPFDEPVAVTPGRTYFLVLQATRSVGSVVWNGTTRKNDGNNSYNYDKPSFGGWVEKPYDLAFEILALPLTQNASQPFPVRGSALDGLEIDFFAPEAGGSLTVEIYDDSYGGDLIGKAIAPVSAPGVQTAKVAFEKPISLTGRKDCRAEISFDGCGEGARVLTDCHTLENDGQSVALSFRVRLIHDVDRLSLITLTSGSSGVQEIPGGGGIVSTVSVLLSKEEGKSGKIRATLSKGEGENEQTVAKKEVDVSYLGGDPEWVEIPFDLPLFKINRNGNYFLKIENLSEDAEVVWHGTTDVDRFKTLLVKDGEEKTVAGEAGYKAKTCEIRLISDYMQTDTTFMLIHAWAMYVKNNEGSPEDREFISESYPIIKSFADYFFNVGKKFNKKLNLLFNPSLEHSRKGRYWQSYDLITNVFASQALMELSEIAEEMQDQSYAEKWRSNARKLEKGINENLVTEYDGKKIYGEFYDAEDDMKFYPGISWVNFAPVAAEWFGIDLEIMKNTYEIYKKYAGIKMLGYNGLATDATLGTKEIAGSLIGKGTAWELMFCRMIGDEERVSEIMALERATAKKYKLSVYPESWTSQNSVSDPGNQEHCAWQVYAVSRVFGIKEE